MNVLRVLGVEDRGAESVGEEDHLEVQSAEIEGIETGIGTEKGIGSGKETGTERGKGKEGPGEENHLLKGKISFWRDV